MRRLYLMVNPTILIYCAGNDHDALAGTLCSSPDVAKVSFTGSTRVGACNNALIWMRVTAFQGGHV